MGRFMLLAFVHTGHNAPWQVSKVVFSPPLLLLSHLESDRMCLLLRVGVAVLCCVARRKKSGSGGAGFEQEGVGVKRKGCSNKP